MSLKIPGRGEGSGDLGMYLNWVNFVDSMNISFSILLIV